MDFAIFTGMKARILSAHAVVLGLFLAALAFPLAGCKTTPKVDWNSRIGTFTYDEAVAELGPPDKFTTLTDGKIVADWITHTSGSSFSFGFGTGFPGAAVGVGQTVGPNYTAHGLRLTFGPDTKLISWLRF